MLAKIPTNLQCYDICFTAVARKHRVHKEEHHRVPRSLFDRPQSLLRKERDQKLMKLKQFPKSLRPQIIQSRPVETEEAHPWMIHEDQALLLVIILLKSICCINSIIFVTFYIIIVHILNRKSSYVIHIY